MSDIQVAFCVFLGFCAYAGLCAYATPYIGVPNPTRLDNLKAHSPVIVVVVLCILGACGVFG